MWCAGGSSLKVKHARSKQAAQTLVKYQLIWYETIPQLALGRLQALLDSMTVNTTFNIHMYLSS